MLYFLTTNTSFGDILYYAEWILGGIIFIGIVIYAVFKMKWNISLDQGNRDTSRFSDHDDDDFMHDDFHTHDDDCDHHEYHDDCDHDD